MSTIERKFKVGAGLEFGDGTSVTSATGLVGATGPQGAAGNTGQTGATGPQGAQGDAGATGAQGDAGAQGDQGLGYGRLTSTTELTVGTGSKTFTVSETLSEYAYADGSTISIRSASGTPLSMVGVITAAPSGNSITVNVIEARGTGTYSDWEINLSGLSGLTGATGPDGATGAQGATGGGFTGLTSDSELTIGTGSKSFTVNTDASASGFQVGSIVSIAAIGSPSNAYGMGGFITSYSGTSLTVSVISTTGSGTYSSWNFILTGRTGNTGATGAQGIQGATGPQGEQGAQGDIGATGPQGVQGVQGTQGEIGATGAQGATGSQGETGLGFNIAKTYASVAALEADTSPSGIDAGEFALINTDDVEDAENSRLYLWNGSSYTYVIDLSGAAGIQGPTGATGAQGASGETGPIGATGAQGVQGEQGIQGPAGATGAQGATGPEGMLGPQGATGSEGPAGATGAAGQTFDLTSSSSVEIGTGNKTFTVSKDASLSGFKVGTLVSVAAIGSPSNAYGVGGFIVSYSGTSLTVSVSSVTGSGTYSSWSFIVAGRTGATGPTGAAGATGAQGSAGETGATGAQGATGPQGPGANQTLDTTSQVTFASVTATNGVSVSTPTAGTTYIPFRTDKSITYQVYRTGITSTATQNILDMGLDSAGFNTFKYLITVIDDDAGTKRIHTQEMLSVVNGTSVFESEYAIVLSSDSLGAFNTIVNMDTSRSLEWVPAADITSATVIVQALALAG
jgi:collagen type VII alpha